jgi:putative molybdopterin biosynthesis protein
VLVHFCSRDQGLLVARGNPLGLAAFKDLKGRKARVAVRPVGAGAQQLLLALLKRDGLTVRDLGKPLLAPTGPDIAQAIRAGHADAGIATRAVAAAAGLDFVPLVTERFDILMRQRDSYRPALKTFLDVLAKPTFASRALELGGLDVSKAGQVRWTP